MGHFATWVAPEEGPLKGPLTRLGPHGVLPRDSHEISPTIGGVHKLKILLRDLVKEMLQNIFGEGMGGSGRPRPPYQILQ